MKRLVAAFFVFSLAAMLWVTVRASLDRNVLDAAVEIWADPWGRATLFDAYLAFLTVWLWIVHREPTWLRRLAWLVLILGLGNFAIAAYFLIALARLRSGEDWRGLFREAPR